MIVELAYSNATLFTFSFRKKILNLDLKIIFGVQYFDPEFQNHICYNETRKIRNMSNDFK